MKSSRILPYKPCKRRLHSTPLDFSRLLLTQHHPMVSLCLPEQSLFTLNIINVATFLSSLHHKRRFLSARYLHRLHEFRLHFSSLSLRLSTRNAAPTSSLGLGDLEIMFCCLFLLAPLARSSWGPPRARWWRNNTQGVSKHCRPTQASLATTLRS